MTSLAELFRITTRFHRSVDLGLDLRRAGALEGYQLTPQVAELTERIVDGLLSESSTERAWALTGPYGTGKSAFALFLSSLLGDPASNAAVRALRLLRKNASTNLLTTRITNFARKRPNGFVVLVVSGSRQALLPAIIDGLAEAVNDFFYGKNRARTLKTEIEKLKRRPRTAVAEGTVTELLGQFAADVRDAGGAGVVVIIDEFGKFLEHAALNPAQGDVFVLQRLAELAVRSAGDRLAIITLLHQTFERYAANLPEQTRDEWRKIQGRFRDAAFIEEPSQLLVLASCALENCGLIPSALTQYFAQTIEAAYAVGVVGSGDFDLFRKLLPLHPTTAAILPNVFRSALSQNERSLFSFLAARFDCGFSAFLARTGTDSGALALYRVEHLHGYLKEAMGPALLATSESKRWAEVEHAVERVPRGAPALTARIVKTVGMLSLFGTPEVRATRQILALALEDRQSPSEELETALNLLERASIIVFRRHRDAYGLWEGSDVNLDERFQVARERIKGSSSVTGAVRRRAKFHPVVARRHFFTTGTLRFFEVDVATPSDLDIVADRRPEEGDGSIIYLLPAAEGTPSELARVAKLATSPERPRRNLLLVAVPTTGQAILNAATDLDAWTEVRQTTAELAGDAVARRELGVRIGAAEERLDELLGQAFGWGDRDAQASSAWFRQGAQVKADTPRELSSKFSEILDAEFALAPIIQNEILNRRFLSSAAAAARRALIDRMLTHGHEEKLGIEGAPPEYSMYASVLEAGGLHEYAEGRGRFGPPAPDSKNRFRPTWDAIERFLDETDGNRKPVTALRDLLAAPPYGVKDGPFYVLLFAVAAAEPGEVALFEDGTFVPEISSAVVERLLRRIEQFEIARYRLDVKRRETLRALAVTVELPEDDASPIEIVKSIIRRVARLPKYARNTRRILATAVDARDAILSARDPLRLIFHDLPASLGLEPIGPGSSEGAQEHAAEYAGRLAEAFREIVEAYPRLLDDIERHFAVALDVPKSGEALRAELVERSRDVAELATDMRLKAFVGRATDAALPHREWLEGLTMVVGGRPPSEWSDSEMTRFEIGLTELRVLFHGAEDLALDLRALAPRAPGVVELMRVSIVSPGRKEIRQLVRLRQTETEAMTQIEGEIKALLEQKLRNRPDAWLAVLGRTLQNLLDRAEQNATASPEVPPNSKSS